MRNLLVVECSLVLQLNLHLLHQKTIANGLTQDYIRLIVIGDRKAIIKRLSVFDFEHRAELDFLFIQIQ